MNYENRGGGEGGTKLWGPGNEVGGGWRCASLVVLPLLVPGGLALARGEHYYDTL